MSQKAVFGQPEPGTVRREKILVTVKAYPTPSKGSIESVCVAGITEHGAWMRLHPVPFRFLASEQQFPTYEWIEVDIRKSPDPRPESHYLDITTLKMIGHVGTEHQWQERRRLISPLRSQSIEDLHDLHALDGRSLGLIRPKQIKRMIINATSHKWEQEDLAKLRQLSLQNEDGTYRAVQELEKIPFQVKYEFICDDARCNGHTCQVFSWEVLQSLRKWREQYGDNWEEKFRQRYEVEFSSPTTDLHFYMGTMRAHPSTWIIVGLFYPPANPAISQPILF